SLAHFFLSRLNALASRILVLRRLILLLLILLALLALLALLPLLTLLALLALLRLLALLALLTLRRLLAVRLLLAFGRLFGLTVGVGLLFSLVAGLLFALVIRWHWTFARFAFLAFARLRLPFARLGLALSTLGLAFRGRFRAGGPRRVARLFFAFRAVLILRFAFLVFTLLAVGGFDAFFVLGNLLCQLAGPISRLALFLNQTLGVGAAFGASANALLQTFDAFGLFDVLLNASHFVFDALGPNLRQKQLQKGVQLFLDFLFAA